MSVSVPTNRLHGLDALRGFVLLLGVALHASMSFMPGAPYFWIVADTSSSVAMNALFYAIHPFRMITFFVLAGFFGRLLCERLGAVAFARDRGRRIVLPLLAAWPLVMTGIVIALVWAAKLKYGDNMPEPPPGPTFAPDDFPLTHLWFLYVLSLFYAAMLALRAVFSRLDRSQRVIARADTWLRVVLGPWAALVLALPLAVMLFAHEGWYAWFGIPTPDTSLYPNRPALVGFGLAFVVGWMLQRQTDLLARIARQRHAHLLVAIGANALCLWLVGWSPAAETAPQDARTAVYAVAYATTGWAWTLALVGYALRHASGYSAARRWLADSAYWVYLAHLPVVMLLQVAASQFDAPWWIEYPAVVALALAVLLASYQFGVRHTAIGRWLGGRRAPLPVSTTRSAGAV
jgi:glucan biosynthesis protein C